HAAWPMWAGVATGGTHNAAANRTRPLTAIPLDILSSRLTQAVRRNEECICRCPQEAHKVPKRPSLLRFLSSTLVNCSESGRSGLAGVVELAWDGLVMWSG